MDGVVGTINEQSVTALCDSGAKSNFIAEHVAKRLKLAITYFNPSERPSYTMGDGVPTEAIGTVKAMWHFKRGPEPQTGREVVYHVLKDCVWDVIMGDPFLIETETMDTHRSHPSRTVKPLRATRTRLVNLCGLPGRSMRGMLELEDCSALADSGSEPNLLSYAYVKQRGWLDKTVPGTPECRVLQFADRRRKTIEGRLRLKWHFLNGRDYAKTGAGSYVDFDVLRGCPYDVVLGLDFLNKTKAFTEHQRSFPDVIHKGRTGLHVVMWAKDRCKKKRGEIFHSSPGTVDSELDGRLEQLAANEWKVTRAKKNSSRELNSTALTGRIANDDHTSSMTLGSMSQQKHQEDHLASSITTQASRIDDPGHSPSPGVATVGSDGSSSFTTEQSACVPPSAEVGDAELASTSTANALRPPSRGNQSHTSSQDGSGSDTAGSQRSESTNASSSSERSTRTLQTTRLSLSSRENGTGAIAELNHGTPEVPFRPSSAQLRT